MNGITNVSRRNFLRTAAGTAGLVLGFTLPETSSAQFQGGVNVGPPPTNKPNAYIHIGTDDSVTLTVIKAEMGQGPYTALSMILAEELDCDWSKVRAEFAPVNPAYYGGIQGVVGSQSVRTLWTTMRTIGATGRAMLVEAAAQRWGVPASQVRTNAGFVVNTVTNARLNYGVIADAASRLPVPANVALKDPKQFRILGKPMKRLDTRDKATGRASFGIDARVPGMVYAVIARCPVFGGKVVRFDASKAKAVPGVIDIVQISTGMAVVAENTWAAAQGRKVLDVTFDEGASANVNSASISRMFADKAAQPGVKARGEGEGAAGLARGVKRMEAVYEAPFLSHAPMEPMNCTASVTADGCEIWASTQMQTPSRDYAAQILGIAPEKVKVNTLFMGGGFGRRARTDYVGETVEIAKAVGKPVKLTWTREDDMQHDWYRPASYVKMAASFDADGWPVAFTTNVACPPFPNVNREGISTTAVDGFEQFKYAIPNVQVDYHRADTHVPVSFWRSVGWSQNGYFLESFVDEMAAASGKDPLEFRLKLLANQPRMVGVLKLVAEKSGWGKPLPGGHFQGIAITNNVGSFTAQVAEISIENGKLKVHKITVATDCGHIVNPMIIRQQLEGGIVYGLAAATKGLITIDKGRVQQSNFNNYDVTRIDEMPRIDIHIVPSTEAPGGMGEASTPGTAPAIANAIFRATGKRIRTLPFRDADLA